MAQKLITFFPALPSPKGFRKDTKGDVIVRKGSRASGFTLSWVEDRICPNQGYSYTRAWIAASYLSVKGYGVVSEACRTKGRPDDLRVYVYTPQDFAHVPEHLRGAIDARYNAPVSDVATG